MKMATITQQTLIAIFLVFAVCCKDCQSDNPISASSSCEKLQISPDALSSMEYGNFLVEIYEHADNRKTTTTPNEKKYFYSPIAILDHKSAVSSYNNVTKQPEMRFRIEMWNDKIQNEVVNHLNEIIGHEIKSHTVRVIPLEKVILSSNIPTADYSLSTVWTNYDRSKTLRLSLSCYDQKVCDGLANEMRSNPEQFDHFNLLYSLSPQTSQTKQTTITIDSITSGQMVTTLLQKFRDKKEVFLTSTDEKRLLAETATNIRMDTFDDSEVGSPDTDLQIYNILKDLLVTSRTTIKEQSDKMWDSVFWNQDNYRPDRTTETLNEIVNKLDEETQKKLADMFQKVEGQSRITEKPHGWDGEQSVNEKWELEKNHSDERNRSLENKERIQHNDSNSWVDVDKISSQISEKIGNNSDSSRRVEVLNEDVVKLLQESRNHVQWDGEKFVPKPMQLGRINLGQFRDSQSFQDRNVRVRYTNAELSAPIKFVEHAKLTVVDEWNNLKDELKDTRELLKTTVMILTKTSTELSNVKSDFTNTKIDLANKLEGTRQELVNTKIELEKTMSDFSKTVDDLSGKLNATENKLAEMKIRAGNSSSEHIRDSSANSKWQRLGDKQKVAEENLKKQQKETLNHLETKTKHLNPSRAEFGKMPTSCADLQRMGHKANGLFLVKGSEKMEVVDCNFYSDQNADLQKWIGYADVKSAPVHFYVQRNSDFKKTATPIPFNLALVNEGYAMNLASGIFTAPRPGIYFFSFTAMLVFPRSSPHVNLEVKLNLNNDEYGPHRTTSGVDLRAAKTVANEFRLLAFYSSRNLKKGDEVWVTIECGSDAAYLVDSVLHFTHFTGFMLEEEIIASSL